jgi:carboxypeptidase Q
VTLRGQSGTDHFAFDEVGVPGFQFIQDGLAYMSRTWHTDLDTFDHGLREDLMQSATIMASFLYHAAMRPERLPRKPMPVAPPKGQPDAPAAPAAPAEQG